MFSMLLAFDTKDYSDHPDIKIIDSENLNTLGVEDIRDVIAIENTNLYNGMYHVLGGVISPIEGIGPEDLNINSLEKKIIDKKVNEIIFALSATIEADTTSFYLFKILNKLDVKVSVLARGIPVGDQLEYTDEVTLARSIQNRRPYESNISNQ